MMILFFIIHKSLFRFLLYIDNFLAYEIPLYGRYSYSTIKGAFCLLSVFYGLVQVFIYTAFPVEFDGKTRTIRDLYG